MGNSKKFNLFGKYTPLQVIIIMLNFTSPINRFLAFDCLYCFNFFEFLLKNLPKIRFRIEQKVKYFNKNNGTHLAEKNILINTLFSLLSNVAGNG